MTRPAQAVGRLLPRGGLSLVEVVVALMLLAGGMLAVTSSGTAVIGQLKTARTEVELWAALQTVGDSLQQLAYGTASSDSRVDGRYNFQWTVDNSVSDPTLDPRLNRITIQASVTEPVARSESLILFVRQ
jgi:Tfp pilus assembly protein PilV